VTRAPRIGWVREVSILLPLVTLLLVFVSTVTLLSYREAIHTLDEALPAAAANPAGELARQGLVVQRLTWVVLPVNIALTLLVLLYLRHLVRPMETLLEQAKGVAQESGDAGGDEIEFLLSTFQRAMAALAARPREEPDQQEIAALQRALGSSLGSGVLLIDSANRVLAVNPVGTELLHLPELPADPPLLAFHLADHGDLVSVLEQATATGHSVSRREIEVSGEDSSTRLLGLTAHPLRRDDGTLRGLLALFVDLTQSRRQADEERRASSLAQLGRMSAGLAHELRNSLAALRGYLTLIEMHKNEDSITDYLGEIRSESDQLQRVLEDFLSFARPEARLDTLSVSALAARLAADPGLEGQRVILHDLTGGELEIRADRQLLERALRNLLRNAAQAQEATHETSPLVLTVEQRQDWLAIIVADRGPGLPPEGAEQLFEPFATTRDGGVGLGLPLAQRIVDLHGGTVELTPREGGGLEARVLLPRDVIVT
jgi:two-component system, NtrC family, sensor histidine kinase PilS